MSNETWLDLAADAVDRLLSSLVPGTIDQDEGSPFSHEQSRVLKEVLQASFTSFGKEIGDIMGRKLADIHLDMRKINDAIAATISSDVNQIEVATLETLGDPGAVTKSGSSRTRARKNRRLRAKQKFEYSRSQLLTLASCKLIGPGPDSLSCPAEETGVGERRFASDSRRISLSLERLLDGPGHVIPSQRGIDASFLKQQCDAARTLQVWWRRRIHRCIEKQRTCNAVLIIQRTWRSYQETRRRELDLCEHGCIQTATEDVLAFIEDVIPFLPPPQLKRYTFAARAISPLVAFLSQEDLEIHDVVLYAGATVAVVSYEADGIRDQKKFDVGDRQALVEVVRRRELRIVSHLRAACPI